MSRLVVRLLLVASVFNIVFGLAHGIVLECACGVVGLALAGGS